MRAPPPPPRPSLGLFLKGAAMGAADVIPGVSGGTMALILGVYERLILSLHAFGRRPFWEALLGLRLREAFGIVDGSFLITLGGGIATALLLLSRVVLGLLERSPGLVFSFFFGLILASCVVVARQVSGWTPRLGAIFLASAAGAFWLVGLSPASTPDAAWFVFLAGAVAICAMILPGISGAFILVLLGKYEVVLEGLSHLQLGVIVPFALGAAAGLLSFAQVLGWLFRHHRDLTLSLLAGFLLGSLRKVWPWPEGGFVNEGLSVGLAPALLLMAVGVGLVALFERLGLKRAS